MGAVNDGNHRDHEGPAAAPDSARPSLLDAPPEEEPTRVGSLEDIEALLREELEALEGGAPLPAASDPGGGHRSDLPAPSPSVEPPRSAPPASPLPPVHLDLDELLEDIDLDTRVASVDPQTGEVRDEAPGGTAPTAEEAPLEAGHSPRGSAERGARRPIGPLRGAGHSRPEPGGLPGDLADDLGDRVGQARRHRLPGALQDDPDDLLGPTGPAQGRDQIAGGQPPDGAGGDHPSPARQPQIVAPGPDCRHALHQRRAARVAAGERRPRVVSAGAQVDRGPRVATAEARGDRGPRVATAEARGDRGPRIAAAGARGDRGPRIAAAGARGGPRVAISGPGADAAWASPRRGGRSARGGR